MRKICKKLHLWLSVPFGIFIMLICFSGAMLVFEKEITELCRPGLYFVEKADGRPLPMDSLMTKVAASLPDSVEATGITVSPDPERTWQVSLSKPRRASVYVDPYTGEVKGRSERLAFFDVMFHLHRWLMGSAQSKDGGMSAGKLLVGASTLVLVFILITGVVIWWPRNRKALKNRLKISVTKGWHRFWYDLHVSAGIYATIFLLALALTGLTWSFSWYRTGFYGLFGIEASAGGGFHGGGRNGNDGSHGGGERGGRPDGKGRGGRPQGDRDGGEWRGRKGGSDASGESETVDRQDRHDGRGGKQRTDGTDSGNRHKSDGTESADGQADRSHGEYGGRKGGRKESTDGTDIETLAATASEQETAMAAIDGDAPADEEAGRHHRHEGDEGAGGYHGRHGQDANDGERQGRRGGYRHEQDSTGGHRRHRYGAHDGEGGEGDGIRHAADSTSGQYGRRHGRAAADATGTSKPDKERGNGAAGRSGGRPDKKNGTRPDRHIAALPDTASTTAATAAEPADSTVTQHHQTGMSPYAQWQRVFDALAQANPGYRQITMQDGRAGVIPAGRLSLRAADNYDFDTASGEITGVKLYRDQEKASKARGSVYMLHVGSWGGIITRILTFLAALIGATLPLTGYYLWIRRLLGKRKH